ncbi:hypothetical protein [Thioclava electrotropha]|uniref:Tyr recombinase domain-containing protein n=1 Tax=Thioclava electrotropha TaxID=1549850 RepID=A0ABX6Z020_9RHOB|nr:hypothetical protein [Thioclava electrotropha]QPZ93380.1 hypothetical protein AKL02_020595 [Thioclava electrotropha]
MAHQPFSRAERVARLLARMQNVPRPVAHAVAEAVVEGTFKGRGAPAALERFYAALAAAGRTPETANREDFEAAASSRTSYRTLISALTRFDPTVPLAPARDVTKSWDRWLNSTYGSKPKKPRRSTRIAALPEQWPAPWREALPLLDRVVRRGETVYKPLREKSRASVVAAIGTCETARTWAIGRGIALGDALCADIAEVFLRYLLVERGISARSAADYFERVEGFAYRGRLFDRDAAEAFADIRGQLRAETEDQPEGKRAKVQGFLKAFDLADILHAAARFSEAATSCRGDSAQAERLRRKSVIFGLLVNGSDRQGDLSEFRIGREISRLPDGTWEVEFRQAKTRRKKELGALWPFTARLLDAHVLADRPSWQIKDRMAELDGMNLLSLGEDGYDTYHPSALLKQEFGISGHLIRTLVTNLIRTEEPDAAWAAQALLGHSNRYSQRAYLTDFRVTASVREWQSTMADLEKKVARATVYDEAS